MIWIYIYPPFERRCGMFVVLVHFYSSSTGRSVAQCTAKVKKLVSDANSRREIHYAWPKIFDCMCK